MLLLYYFVNIVTSLSQIEIAFLWDEQRSTSHIVRPQ